jgi:hypothetical protein
MIDREKREIDRKAIERERERKIEKENFKRNGKI